MGMARGRRPGGNGPPFHYIILNFIKRTSAGSRAFAIQDSKQLYKVDRKLRVLQPCNVPFHVEIGSS